MWEEIRVYLIQKEFHGSHDNANANANAPVSSNQPLPLI